jgi:methylenetetrahydrofolate reductase (NADH)
MTRNTEFTGFSLEMTAKDTQSLRVAAPGIPKSTPISITFLPNEDVAARLRAAALVKNLGFEPMPHISARRLSSLDELQDYLSSLTRVARTDRAFVIAGDLLSPQGPFPDALAVIQSGELARYGVKCVGVAGYPESHPHISHERLWSALESKHRALMELGHEVEIMTQFGFNAKPMLSWLERLRQDAKITAVVRLGVPGPGNVKTLLRFASRCGVNATARVMAKYGVTIAQLLRTAGPDLLLDELQEGLTPSVHGEVRFHFYPFGGLEKTVDWIGNYAVPALARA